MLGVVEGGCQAASMAMPEFAGFAFCPHAAVFSTALVPFSRPACKHLHTSCAVVPRLWPIPGFLTEGIAAYREADSPSRHRESCTCVLAVPGLSCMQFVNSKWLVLSALYVSLASTDMCFLQTFLAFPPPPHHPLALLSVFHLLLGVLVMLRLVRGRSHSTRRLRSLARRRANHLSAYFLTIQAFFSRKSSSKGKSSSMDR